MSINPELPERVPSGGNHSLREILNVERKAIRRDDAKADKGWAIVNKKVMKQVVGHSPDFFEALIYKKIFDIKVRRHVKPRLMRYVNPARYS